MRRLGLALLLLAPSAVPARAMTADQEKLVQSGLDDLYNSDYDGADRVFAEARRKAPDDPVAALGAAISAWWRMENDFASPGSAEQKAFKAAVKRSIDVGEKAARGKDEALADLCLGASFGLRGRAEAAQRHWFSAYLAGRKAYKYGQKAVKLDPQEYDAYLGLGAFDYYVATLSRFVRALAFTSGGGKDKGLAELQLAADRGRFSPVAAKLLLVSIDWTFEKEPQDAWKLLDELHGRYPESPFIDSMRLIGLYHLRDAAELQRQARAYLEKAQRGAPNFRPIDRTVGRYFLGLGEQLAGDPLAALKDYQTALVELPPDHRSRTLVHLFVGEASDLLGRRDDAVAAYHAAVDGPPFWGVARYARWLLKHPFKPAYDPLPSRNESLD